MISGNLLPIIHYDVGMAPDCVSTPFPNLFRDFEQF